jgi:hypothetical protein
MLGTTILRCNDDIEMQGVDEGGRRGLRSGQQGRRHLRGRNRKWVGGRRLKHLGSNSALLSVDIIPTRIKADSPRGMPV